MHIQNHSQKPRSLQELIQKRQSSTFVGREEFIETFKNNLSLNLTDHRKKFLFHVWGQGGIGKSFLLKQFESIIQDNEGISCQTDEDYQEVPKILSRFIQQVDKNGHNFKEFKELYKVYQQKREEIENDPESPRGITSLIGKAIAKGTLDAAEQVPVLGTASMLLDKEAISDKVGDWATYLMRKITNKDEVKLLLNPEEILTPAFIEGLKNIERKYQCIGIIFDAFEVTKPYIETWLLNFLKGTYGELPVNLIVITAGRSEFDKNYWTQYESIMSSCELQPFTEKECKEFLRRKNIVDEKIINLVMNLSSNIPLLVATLAVGENESWDMLGDPSDTAVERFLKWVDESEKRKLALDASLLRRLNRDLITELLANENSEDLFIWLKSMPFVQKRSEGWVYHTVVREQMVRYKKRESLTKFIRVHEKFSSYYEKLSPRVSEAKDNTLTESEIRYFTEFVYHKLSTDPDHEIDNAIKSFLAILKQNERSALKVAEAILQVGNEQDHQKIIGIGELLCSGLGFAKRDHKFKFNGYSRIRMLEKLIEVSPKDWWLYVDRAHTFYLLNEYKQALKNYRVAIDLDYKNHWIFERVGEVLSNLGEFDSAIEALLIAEEKNQECPSCFLIKAETYNLMRKYDEAILNIDTAIFLAPQHHQLYRKKGEILFNQERYIEALVLLETAVELAPNCFTCLARKAGLNQEAGNMSAALSDYDKLLAIQPDNASILVQKGSIYQEMGEFSEALKAFNLAIDIERAGYKDQAKQTENECREEKTERLPEDIFIKRKKYISRKRAYKQSLKSLKELGFFLGAEASRLLIAYNEDPVVRRELLPFLEEYKDLFKARPFLLKAFLCQKMRRFEAALSNVDRAISISGSDLHYSCRGRIFLQMGNFQMAFEDFKKSLSFFINQGGSFPSFVSCQDDNMLRHLPNNFEFHQLVYEITVAKIKANGFASAKEDAAIVMRILLKSINSEDRTFVLYFISGLYALTSQKERAIEILARAVENEPFLYNLACYDVAWEKFWNSSSFKALRPLDGNGADTWRGFGLQ